MKIENLHSKLNACMATPLPVHEKSGYRCTSKEFETLLKLCGFAEQVPSSHSDLFYFIRPSFLSVCRHRYWVIATHFVTCPPMHNQFLGVPS